VRADPRRGRQFPGLVATWRLEPSCGIWRRYAQQAVQLSVDIHDPVVIIMAADQEDPGSLRRLECDNDS
jgi:hypothetical protein